MDFYIHKCAITATVVPLIAEILQCLSFKILFPLHYGTLVYRNHLHKTGITLTYWSQLLQYCARELGKQCFRWCFVIWWHHRLNKCWLIISEVLWDLPEGNFTGKAQDIFPSYEFENYAFQSSISQGSNELTRKKITCLLTPLTYKSIQWGKCHSDMLNTASLRPNFFHRFNQ